MNKSLAALLLCACVSTAHANIFQFGLNSTNDSGGLIESSFVVPSNGSIATGGEVGVGISYDNAISLLDFNTGYGLLAFAFQPLQGNFVSAKLYQGPVGSNGIEIYDLAPYHTPIGTKGGVIFASLTLPIALDQALFNNELYIQINSTAFPGGEIRAQLIPTAVPEPSTWLLAGLGLAGLLIFRKR